VLRPCYHRCCCCCCDPAGEGYLSGTHVHVLDDDRQFLSSPPTRTGNMVLEDVGASDNVQLVLWVSLDSLLAFLFPASIFPLGVPESSLQVDDATLAISCLRVAIHFFILHNHFFLTAIPSRHDSPTTSGPFLCPLSICLVPSEPGASGSAENPV